MNKEEILMKDTFEKSKEIIERQMAVNKEKSVMKRFMSNHNYDNIIICHHLDLDGYTSYALAKVLIERFVDTEDKEIHHVSMNYAKETFRSILRWEVGPRINYKNSLLVFVDLSFNIDASIKDVIDMANEGSDIIYIDHHIKTFQHEMLKEYEAHDNIAVFGQSGISASMFVATLIDLYAGYEHKLVMDKYSHVPFVQYVNDWDVFNHYYECTYELKVAGDSYLVGSKGFEIFYDESKGFTFFSDELEKIDPDDLELGFYYDGEVTDEWLVNILIRTGKFMARAIDDINRRAVESYSVPIMLGDYICLTLNTTESSSKTFGEEFENYDCVMVYRAKENRITASVYSKWDSEFDCNEFAKQFGGGGHTHAAGFSISMDKYYTPVEVIEKLYNEIIKEES